MTVPPAGPGDRIEIRGLELLLFCGVLPEEQERRQPFRIDVDLYLDLAPAGTTDDLAGTVDYGAVTHLLAERLDADRFQLVERLAARIADLILAEDLVDAVTVTVTKLRPPIGLSVATTGVRIHRVGPGPAVGSEGGG